MHINQVWAAYFSGTDTTKTIVTTIAQEIAQTLGVPCAELNFTPPQAREQHYTFAPTDLVLCGTPVIAGRVPNVLLPSCPTGSPVTTPWRCRWCSSGTGTMTTR